jgi:hypothetical protein
LILYVESGTVVDGIVQENAPTFEAESLIVITRFRPLKNSIRTPSLILLVHWMKYENPLSQFSFPLGDVREI